MKHWWWKVLGVALVLFASISALVVPLAPGIVHVSAQRLAPGPQTFTITGYNTHFASATGQAVWLEFQGLQQCAFTTGAGSDTQLRAEVDLPKSFAGHLATLVVWNDQDGRMRLPDAIWVEGDPVPVEPTDAACVPANTAVGGVFSFPNRSLLYETIRNLLFHVPMWFTMMLLQTIAFVASIRHLSRGEMRHDRLAFHAVNVSLVFAALGLITGSIWARATWGGWWTNDTKLNGAAVTALMYLAYLVLRGSVNDARKRGRLAAIYNIFAFVLMLVFIMVLPRLNDSLHPGNGGNPAFSQYDLDDDLRRVFYPAVVGWMLMGTWMLDLKQRLGRVNDEWDAQ